MTKVNLPLTKKEKRVLDFIIGYVVYNGFAPTRQEIGTNFGFTPQGAQKFIQNLISKGKIKLVKQRGKNLTSRNIVVLKNKTGMYDYIVDNSHVK